MKLLLILILLIFILLYVYNTKIDTFSGETTSSGNSETTSSGNTEEQEDEETVQSNYKIKINTEIKDENNIKISWIKPTSLKINDYYIILDKIEKNRNNEYVVVNKQIYTYKNKKEHVIVDYFIGKLENGYYNIYIVYDIIDNENKVKRELSNVTQIVINHIDKSFIPLLDNVLVNSSDELYNIQYNKIKGSIYEKNTIKDNYNINIY